MIYQFRNIRNADFPVRYSFPEGILIFVVSYDFEWFPRFCLNILSENFSHGSLESCGKASFGSSNASLKITVSHHFPLLRSMIFRHGMGYQTPFDHGKLLKAVSSFRRRTGWTAQNLEMLLSSSLRMEHLVQSIVDWECRSWENMMTRWPLWDSTNMWLPTQCLTTSHDI